MIRTMMTRIRSWMIRKLGAVEPTIPPDRRVGLWAEIDGFPDHRGFIEEDYFEFPIRHCMTVKAIYINFGTSRRCLGRMILSNAVPANNGDTIKVSINDLFNCIETGLRLIEVVYERKQK